MVGHGAVLAALYLEMFYICKHYIKLNYLFLSATQSGDGLSSSCITLLHFQFAYTKVQVKLY